MEAKLHYRHQQKQKFRHRLKVLNHIKCHVKPAVDQHK